MPEVGTERSMGGAMKIVLRIFPLVIAMGVVGWSAAKMSEHPGREYLLMLVLGMIALGLTLWWAARPEKTQ